MFVGIAEIKHFPSDEWWRGIKEKSAEYKAYYEKQYAKRTV